jgi:hypothetical protein
MENAINALETAGAQAERIGNVTGKQRIEISYGNKRFALQ